MAIFIMGIDGTQYPSLPVIRYESPVEILDGPGSGRMQGVGWPMFRDPQGYSENISLTLGLPYNSNSNAEYVDLIEKLKSFGTIDFLPVTFITPSGPITQKMYSASFNRILRRITHDNVSYWGVLDIDFVAQRGKKL